VTREQLEALARETPSEQKQNGQWSEDSPEVRELRQWLSDHGLEIASAGPYNDSYRFILKACPFHSAHVEAAVFVSNRGAPGFHCFHSGCADKHWSDVERLLEPETTSSRASVSDDYTPHTPTMKHAPIAPVLHPDALYGLPGDVIKTIEPCSEADPATLLLHLLTGFSNVIGRAGFFRVERTHHYTNLFYVAVGDTSRGRKGTSWGQIRLLLEAVDPNWAVERIKSGLSSGEGLISAIAGRDGRNSDKRLLVVQTEFGGALQVLNREGNTLSSVLRDAWDGAPLTTMTRKDPLHVEDAHLSIIGHITREELKRGLSQTESFSGFANRFLWARSHRSKYLPEGAEPDLAAIDDLVERLKSAIHAGKATSRMTRDKRAGEWWDAQYRRLSDGLPGLLGGATSRAEAQVVRLSMLFALFDCTSKISAEHMIAADAVWRYCFDSAKFIFGSALGYPLADEIWNALKVAGNAGLSRTRISSDVLGRNYKAAQITNALVFLEEHALAHRRDVGEARFTTEVWYAGPRIENGPVTAH
jgi:hypothetical protein